MTGPEEPRKTPLRAQAEDHGYVPDNDPYPWPDPDGDWAYDEEGPF